MNKAVTLLVALMLLCGMGWASNVTSADVQQAPVRGAEPPAVQTPTPPLPTQDAVLLTENFNGSWGTYANNPPPGWYIYYSVPANQNDWYRYYYSSTYQYMARLYYSPTETDSDWIRTPTINCGTYKNVTLQLYTIWNRFTNPYTAQLQGSTDDGATWPYVIYTFSPALPSHNDVADPRD